MASEAIRMRQSLRRDIVKQGYLKKLPNAARVGASLKRPERRWFVFGVVGVGTEAEPYIEYYENEDKLFSNTPINMIMLDSCRYVIRNDTNSKYTNVFTLVLKDRHLCLVAARRNEMLDWCGVIETRLKYLGILQSGDNDYIEVPWSRPRPPTQSDFIPPPTGAGRNPTSPLPPPPPTSSSPLPELPPTASSSSSSSPQLLHHPLPPTPGASNDLLHDSSDSLNNGAVAASNHSSGGHGTINNSSGGHGTINNSSGGHGTINNSIIGGGIYENHQIITWQSSGETDLLPPSTPPPPPRDPTTPPPPPRVPLSPFATLPARGSSGGAASASGGASASGSSGARGAAGGRSSNLYSETPGILRLKQQRSTASAVTQGAATVGHRRRTVDSASLVAASTTSQQGGQRASIASSNILPSSRGGGLATDTSHVTFQAVENRACEIHRSPIHSPPPPAAAASTESEDDQPTYSLPNKKPAAAATAAAAASAIPNLLQDLPPEGSTRGPGAAAQPVSNVELLAGLSHIDILDTVPKTDLLTAVSDVISAVSSNTVQTVSSPSSTSPSPPTLPPHPTSPLVSPLSPTLPLSASFPPPPTTLPSFSSDISSPPSPSPPSPPSLSTIPSAVTMATGGNNNLIDLDNALDSDEDTYEPVWDQTHVTQNPQELYSVPRPHPRPVNGAATASAAPQPPLLPPKTNQRASVSNAAFFSSASVRRDRSPNSVSGATTTSLSSSQAGAPSYTSSSSSTASTPSTPVRSGGGGGGNMPHVMLPAYSVNYPNSPTVGAEAYPPSTDLPCSLLSPKLREALSSSSSSSPGSQGAAPSYTETSSPVVSGWNSPPTDTTGAPPPYLPRGALERGANKSLKLSQVEQLQKEMKNSGGVKVVLRRLDCYLTVAIVDCCNTVWVAGWNQQARPFLHNAFHIGDRVISINGQVVENARMAQKLIKHSGEHERITFILQRTPHARVLALKRCVEGEALGIRRVNGTAEISQVDPAGLAGRQGLSALAPTVTGDNLNTWWITEINMRPLNLFFKDNEIEPRLNAVGKDISLMVQPSDFVKELKKQLKAMKKMPYKDFLLS